MANSMTGNLQTACSQLSKNMNKAASGIASYQATLRTQSAQIAQAVRGTNTDAERVLLNHIREANAALGKAAVALQNASRAAEAHSRRI